MVGDLLTLHVDRFGVAAQVEVHIAALRRTPDTLVRLALPEALRQWRSIVRRVVLGADQPDGAVGIHFPNALRRRIALANPLVPLGPLVFVKGVPSAFSHQLTQYYGSDAKPGGGLFVLEALSVIFQVASFKLRKKRIFRMAPLHHHFELKGWAEPKVIVRFWIITIFLALLAFSTLKLR